MEPLPLAPLPTMIQCKECGSEFHPKKSNRVFCYNLNCINGRGSKRSKTSKTHMLSTAQQVHPVVVLRATSLVLSSAGHQLLDTLRDYILDPINSLKGIDRLQGAAMNKEVYFKLPDDEVLQDAMTTNRVYLIDELGKNRHTLKSLTRAHARMHT